MTTLANPVGYLLRYVPKSFLWSIQDLADTWAGVPGAPTTAARAKRA